MIAGVRKAPLVQSAVSDEPCFKGKSRQENFRHAAGAASRICAATWGPRAELSDFMTPSFGLPS